MKITGKQSTKTGMCRAAAVVFLMFLVTTQAADNCETEIDPQKLSHLSSIVVVGQTAKSKYFDKANSMYTAIAVKKTFQTKTGGLKKKKDKINVLTSDCYGLEKNTQYLLYLNATSEKKTFTLAYAPTAEPTKKEVKFIQKKILCKKCSVVAPSFKKKESSMQATEGEKYQIQCKAAGKPKPNMSWLFNGQPLNPKKLKVKVSKKKPGKSTLTISKVQASKHEGTFICIAENASPDSASYMVSLTVLPAPTTTPLTCTRCDPSYCFNNGECCVEANNSNLKRCVCSNEWRGERCKTRVINQNRAGPGSVTEQDSVIAVLGLCVALLLSLVICAAAYLFCLKPKNCKCRNLEKPGIEGSTYYRTDPNHHHHQRDDQQRSLLARNSTSISNSAEDNHVCNTTTAQQQQHFSANNSQSNNTTTALGGGLSSSQHGGSDVSIEMKRLSSKSRSSVTSNSGRARLNGVAKEVVKTQYRPSGYTSEGSVMTANEARKSSGAGGDQFSNPTYYPSQDIPFASSVSHPASLAAHHNISSPPMYSSYNANQLRNPDTSFHISETGGSSVELGGRHPSSSTKSSYPIIAGSSSSLLASSSKQLNSPSSPAKASDAATALAPTASLDVLKSDTEQDTFLDSLEDVKIPDMALNISPSVTQHNPPRVNYKGAAEDVDSEKLFFPSPTPVVTATVASAQRTHLPLLSNSYHRDEVQQPPPPPLSSDAMSASSSDEDLTEGRSIEI